MCEPITPLHVLGATVFQRNVCPQNRVTSQRSSSGGMCNGWMRPHPQECIVRYGSTQHLPHSCEADYTTVFASFGPHPSPPRERGGSCHSSPVDGGGQERGNSASREKISKNFPAKTPKTPSVVRILHI
jgi:hypothetical protein